MSTSAPRSTRMEPLLARLLTVAITLAGATLAVGIALSIAHSPHAKRVLFAGLTMLALTPIARVVCSLTLFAWQRAWVYVAACVLVLALIGGGLWFGLGA